MTTTDYRVERDSMGALDVPAAALWGAQTQRAIQNFPPSGLRMPRAFIRALGLIKRAAAGANAQLGDMAPDLAAAIQASALEVAEGEFDDQFPVDVFQTGSGTSSNMNANEVIATLAGRRLGRPVHPNDHVNMSQSSNDVVPTAIHVAAVLILDGNLLHALRHLSAMLERRAREFGGMAKTGRTHLMDAMPLTLAQEFGGWRAQIDKGCARLSATMPRLLELAQGGTAVGTGINARPGFAAMFARHLSADTRLEFAAQRQLFRGAFLPGHGGRVVRAAEGGRRQSHEDSERPALDEQRAAGRVGGDLAAGIATGQQHHARQGESGGSGGGGDDRGAGHRQRCDDHRGGAVGKFSIERHAAGDRPQFIAEPRIARHREPQPCRSRARRARREPGAPSARRWRAIRFS